MSEMNNETTNKSHCTHSHHDDGCGCGCTHNHQHAASRSVLLRIIVTAVCMVVMHFLPVEGWGRLACYVAVYLFAGWNILKEAAVNVMHGRVFDENFLIVVATLGAFALAIVDETGDYDEAIAVIWFFQVGEYFLGYAINKSQESVLQLTDIRSCDTVVEGDTISACDNHSGDSSESETFIRRFARYYTPIVCYLSLALIIIPPAVMTLLAAEPQLSLFHSLLSTWTYRALTLLVVSCPCALVISIPMTFFACIGGAKRCGIIINNSSSIEKLAKLKTENFGKTAKNAENCTEEQSALAASGVNFAVVGVSSEDAIKSADIVLMSDGQQKMAQAIHISRMCMTIVWQNITIAIGIKVACLVLSAFGITNMWLAVFADTGVLILAVINAMRGVLVKK